MINVAITKISERVPIFICAGEREKGKEKGKKKLHNQTPTQTTVYTRIWVLMMWFTNPARPARTVGAPKDTPLDQHGK